MEKSIITTGKTLDLAIEAALKQLNMDRDSVSVEIIENAKSGFLGIGAVPAKVKVTYEAPEEDTAPKPALSSASRSKPKKPAALRMDTVVVPQPKPAEPMPPTPQDMVERRGERRSENGGRNSGYRGSRSGAPRGPRPSSVPERTYAPRDAESAAPVAPKRTERVDDFADFSFGKIEI